MRISGTFTVDGKEHRIDATSISCDVVVAGDKDPGPGGSLMGTQIKETLAISGDTITTSVTTISSDGKTTRTETTTSTPTSTTTTTTTTTEK